MFEGELGKKTMIQRGYVPTTCELPVDLAGPLIYAEISAARDPCGGCNGNRATCGGRPKYEDIERAIIEGCGGPEPIGLLRSKPRPVYTDQMTETDYDEVILVDSDGEERETIRKWMGDEFEWEDSTTLRDQSRGFKRYVAIRPKRSEELEAEPDFKRRFPYGR